MSIHLHIERLIVDGLLPSSREAPALREALERQLASLLAGAAPAHGWSTADVYRLDAPHVTIAQHATPAQVGEQIAGAVHRSLTA